MRKTLFVILLSGLIFLPHYGRFDVLGQSSDDVTDENDSAVIVLEDEQVAFSLSKRALAEHCYGVAVRLLSAFAEAFPMSENVSLAHLLMGQAYYHLREYDEASAALQRAAETKGGEKFSTAISFWAAKCDLARGFTDRAQEAFGNLAQQTPPNQYHVFTLYNVALCHEARGEFEKAIQQFQLVRKADKENRLSFACSLHESRCLAALRRAAEAQEMLLASIEKDPRNPDVDEAFFLLGEIAASLEDYDSSLKYYRRSLGEDGLDDWYPEAWYGIAWCLLKLSRYDEATQVLENIRKLQPGKTLIKKSELSLCRLRLLKGENEAAIKALRQYISRYPEDKTIPEAEYLVAEALLNAANLQAASQQYDRVISSFPSVPLLDRVHFGKGRALFLSGNYGESVDAFRKAGKLSEDPKLQLEAARGIAEALYRQEDYAGAAATYREVLERTSSSENPDEILFRLGWCYYKQGEYDSAIASLETLLTKFPESQYADNALYRLGGAYFRKGEYEKALVEYQRLEKDYPRSELLDSTKYQMGLCNYNMGRYYVALVTFRQVTEKFPKSPLAERCSYEMGWCHHQLGKEQQALEHFQAHIARYGKTELSAEALFWIGEWRYNGGDYDQACQAFQQLAEQYPGHRLADRASYWQGRAALNSANYREAVEAFSRLAERSPGSALAAEAVYQMGIAFKAQELFAEALVAFEKARALHLVGYLQDELTWQIADCLLALGRNAQSLSTYTELLRSDDPRARARGRYGRGRCFQEAGKYSAAIAELMVVIWEFPGEEELVSQSAFAAARCYEKLGRRHNAIRAYSLIIEGNLPGKEKAEEAIQALRKKSLLFFIKQR